MNLKSLSNHELHLQTVELAGKEREFGIKMLHHLREIEQRRYYAVLGYSSLWDYCINELKYSSGAAQRRISSMRLLKELPCVETQLQDGSLNLSLVAQAQQFFKDQKKTNQSAEETTFTSDVGGATKDSSLFVTTLDQKLEVLKSLEHKSAREAEKIFARLAPKEIPAETSRQLTADKTEVRFVLESRGLEEIKDLAVGALGMNPTYAELWRWMVNKILKQNNPNRKTKKPVKSVSLSPVLQKPVPQKTVSDMPKKAASNGMQSNALQAPVVENQTAKISAEATKPSRYIPAAVRREVFERDKWQCGYFDSITGRRCTETRGIEIDHVIAYARGGKRDPDNLRLRCRTHNLLHAEQTFGAAWMTRHYK